MTSKEAIEDLKFMVENDDFGTLHVEAIEMAISALQTESCEDAVSRKEVLSKFGELLGLWGRSALMELNPVQLKTKTGKWILVHPLQADDEGGYVCSECGTGYYDNSHWNYCPNCGNPKGVTK